MSWLSPGGLVAASASAGAVVNPDGLDVAGLTACKADGGSVAQFRGLADPA